MQTFTYAYFVELGTDRFFQNQNTKLVYRFFLAGSPQLPENVFHK